MLLALAWSQQHELDILTTIQNVAFIDGKAVVDANTCSEPSPSGPATRSG